MVCCNAACGICTPPDGACVQGCIVDAGAGDAGGSGGQGGGHADAGKETCDQLVTDYANALAPARACMPAAANQCQTLVQDTLSSCTGCQQYVNDATRLNAIRNQWMSQGCLQTGIVCPAILCVLPGPTKCIAGDSGAGMCTISPPIAN
jgi:hypothetical protein